MQQFSTIRQAATRLAVSPATIRRLIEMAELPAIRVGRCVRLCETAIDALIRRKYTARISSTSAGDMP